MWTKSIAKGSYLSGTELLNQLADFGFEEAEAKETYIEITTYVNTALPGSLQWMPEFSEIWADRDDDSCITEEEFKDLLNNAFAASVY